MIITNNFYITGISLIFLIALFFQFIKIISTKSTHDLSLIWIILTTIGTVCSFIYGLYYNVPSVYIVNGLQMCLSPMMLILKLYYDKLKCQI